MKEEFDNLNYLLKQLEETLIKFRFDFPEDVYKILYDLLYHSLNTVKEMEAKYNEQQELICSRDNSTNRL